VDEPNARNLVHEFARELSAEQWIIATIRLLNKYETIADAQARKDGWRGQNLDSFLRELIIHLADTRTPADDEYFLTRLSADFKGLYYYRLETEFAARFHHLTDGERSTFEMRLGEQWEAAFYDYQAENRMAESTIGLWRYLSIGTRANLIRFAVRILLSDRRPNFAQYKFAQWALDAESQTLGIQEEIVAAFGEVVRESAKSWVLSGWIDAEAGSGVVRYLADANKAIRPFISHYEERIETIVTEVQAAAANAEGA
jgi:hypothetical protein